METLKLEVMLHWGAVLLYVAAAVTFSISTLFDKQKLFKVAVVLTMIGLIPHTAAILIRWSATGHGPYMARYEVMSSNGWVILVMFLLFSIKMQKIRFSGMIVLPYVFLTMTYGLFSNPEIKRLPPSLESIWLVLHVTFYKLAVGAILISLAAAVVYILKEKRGETGKFRRFPTIDKLDYYSHRFAGFGFTFWSIGIIAGSIWANQSWGRYWGWDPIETWSLVTWLFYGLYLHMRFFFGWTGKKAAWLIIGCFAFSFMTAFVIPFVSGSIHSEYFT